jgi:hypothetical protein
LLPSALFPVAVNGTVALTPTNRLAGVTVIVLGSDMTFKVAADPVTEPREAVMIVTPPVRPVASPVPLTLATVGLDEFQDATVDRSFVVPSV